MQIAVSFIVLYALAAGAFLSVSSARAVLRAVGEPAPSLFSTPYRLFITAEPHYFDPRVPRGIQVRVVASRFLGAAAFLIMGGWWGLWLGDSRMGAVGGGVGLFALGTSIMTLRRFRATSGAQIAS